MFLGERACRCGDDTGVPLLKVGGSDEDMDNLIVVNALVVFGQSRQLNQCVNETA